MTFSEVVRLFTAHVTSTYIWRSAQFRPK